ncbi:neuronal acetylcholine receptor subunit alpha-6-like isoform X1 [Schistocerca cancellata]|uniref:neuronal acetylcholine receptor subunit alpha-6-like isoform X1 n=1 Tax=Schistocerca cancellata TaxID=274614 RepID=UPI0021189C3F|nr:neuronal acetylcholine receptor subunit alpha-6-like isoform X1 [Schistocerca cancellata]
MNKMLPTLLPLALFCCAQLLMCEAYPGICLRGHLLASYDKLVRPVKKQNDTVTVEVRLDVLYISVGNAEDYITVAGKTFVTWTDQYLTWTPSLYEGVENITISSDDIWTPDITLVTMSALDFSLAKFPSTECTLYSTGKITCLPYTYYMAHCDLDLQNWPYDVHTCTMWFSSWSHRGKLVNATFNGKGLDTTHMEKDRVWDVIKAETSLIGHGSWPSLGFKFTMKRHATGHEIRVVVVGVVLCLITLFSWFLPSDCGQRLTVCVVSLFLHMFCLLHVAFEIYFYGKSVPHLVLLLRDSLIITCISLVGAVLSQGLFYASRPVPKWLNELITSPASRLLMYPTSLPSQQSTGKDDNEDKTNSLKTPVPSEWKLAAVILDRTGVYIMTLTYIILLAVTIPKY